MKVTADKIIQTHVYKLSSSFDSGIPFHAICIECFLPIFVSPEGSRNRDSTV